MAFIVMDIMNPDEDSFEEPRSPCAKCQKAELAKDLQILGSNEYCHPCYSETIQEIAEQLPGVIPQLEIVK